MNRAFIGLGANIGEPRRQIEVAIEEVGKLPKTRLVSTSSIYRSTPVGYADQPDFLNAVIEIDTSLAPAALLDQLQEIEKRHGRDHPFPNAPRTLDLDLLLYGERVIVTPELTLPHPRMHGRAFVLEPLAEIAPDIVIPGKGAARNLLAGCRGQTIERTD